MARILAHDDQARPRKAQGYQNDEKEAERYAAKLLAKAEVIVGSANKIYGIVALWFFFFFWMHVADNLAERKMQVEIEE